MRLGNDHALILALNFQQNSDRFCGLVECDLGENGRFGR